MTASKAPCGGANPTAGFLKAAKKHDRKRGHAYRVRPLMQVRLAELPFNKEDLREAFVKELYYGRIDLSVDRLLRRTDTKDDS